jgi:hypothetical protein
MYQEGEEIEPKVFYMQEKTETQLGICAILWHVPLPDAQNLGNKSLHCAYHFHLRYPRHASCLVVADGEKRGCS